MTLGYTLKRIATMIALAFIGVSTFIGCSDDEGSGQVAPTPYTYRWVNNQCVDQNNTPVNQSYCNNTNNGGICYNQFGQQIPCTNNNNGICYNQFGQQIPCSTGGGNNNGSCASGEVYVPGFTPSCMPQGNCGINGRASFIWNGYCYSL